MASPSTLRRAGLDARTVFDQAFENAPIGMALADPEGRLLRINPALTAMLGRSAEDLAGVYFADITHPDDIEADLVLFREVLAGTRNGYRLHKRYLRADGGVVEACLSVTATRDAEGAASLFVAQVEDVTERRAAERRLREDAARLALAVEALQGGFWHLDIATGRFETSAKLAGFVEGAGASPCDLQGYCAHIDPADLPAADLSPLVRGESDRSSAEYRLHTAAGLRWVRCDRRLVRDHLGRPEQVVGVVIDVTDEHERQARSQAEAETDALTGLLNRRGLKRRFERVEAAGCGVLAIDLDCFKQVNDRHGHAAGDAVLVECARRLQRETRGGDLLARLGGDEFAVVVPVIGEHALAQLAERVARTLAEPWFFAGARLSATGSVGAYRATGGESLDSALEAADAALYRVKATERGRWRLAS